MLKGVVVLGLEVLMNHIALDEKDMLGSSVVYFDGIIYERKLWVHFYKIS